MSAKPPQPHRKVKPHHTETGISTEAVMSAAVVLIILLAIGLFLGLSNRTTLSDIPAPTYENGTKMQAGDRLYTVEEIILSYAAGDGHENPNITMDACREVVVTELSETDTIVGRINGEYWVSIAGAGEPTRNGWVRLSQLSQDQPADCPEESEQE